MHIDEFFIYHGVVVPVVCMQLMIYIYNLEAIIRKQNLDFLCRLCKSCNTIVLTLENAWIIRIHLWYT